MCMYVKDIVCICLRIDLHGDDIYVTLMAQLIRETKFLDTGVQDYFNQWNAYVLSGCVACTCTMNISGPPPSLRFSLYSWHWRRRQRAWTVSQDSKPGTKSELALLSSACSCTCYTQLRWKPGSITDFAVLCCKLYELLYNRFLNTQHHDLKWGLAFSNKVKSTTLTAVKL